MKYTYILIVLILFSCVQNAKKEANGKITYISNEEISPLQSTLNTKVKLLQLPEAFRFTMDSIGFSKIKDANVYTARGDKDVFDIDSTNSHFVDFNNDGLEDIIYQENRRHAATILLMRKGNDFIEIWSGPGTLVDIKQASETVVYVKSNAIGCFYYNMLNELTIKSDNSITESTIGHHFDTNISDLSNTFTNQEITGILRTQPIENNKEKTDPCTGDSVKGNQLKTIENEVVTVLKTQNNWLLVLHNANNTGMISWVLPNKQ